MSWKKLLTSLRVHEHLRAASTLGVTGTPTIFTPRLMITGLVDVDELRRMTKRDE